MVVRIGARLKAAYSNKPAIWGNPIKFGNFGNPVLGILVWIQNNLESLMIDRMIDASFRAEQMGIRLVFAGMDPPLRLLICR
jgi:hypothetical protein